MITLEAVLDIVPAIRVIVALVYYGMTLRYTSKARQRELIYQRFQGYSMEYTRAFADVINYQDWEDAEEWQEKYGAYTNPEAFSKYIYIMANYNLARILLRERVADPDLIFQLYPANSDRSIGE